MEITHLVHCQRKKISGRSTNRYWLVVGRDDYQTITVPLIGKQFRQLYKFIDIKADKWKEESEEHPDEILTFRQWKLKPLLPF